MLCCLSELYFLARLDSAIINRTMCANLKAPTCREDALGTARSLITVPPIILAARVVLLLRMSSFARMDFGIDVRRRCAQVRSPTVRNEAFGRTRSLRGGVSAMCVQRDTLSDAEHCAFNSAMKMCTIGSYRAIELGSAIDYSDLRCGSDAPDQVP